MDQTQKASHPDRISATPAGDQFGASSRFRPVGSFADILAAGPERHISMRNTWLTAFAILLASCAAPTGRPTDSEPTDFYFWQPAVTDEPRGWILMLPGASGLTVLDDDRHYPETATVFNELGFDVLMVDYKPAFRASRNPPESSSSEKIAWVTERAVTWMWHEHPRTKTRQGTLVAWSLGAEGALRIVNDSRKTRSLQLDAAVLYYPSNFEQQRLANSVPLLILVGDADDLTPADVARKLVASRADDAAPVELVVYPGAQHGFDIESLKTPRTIRLLPLYGPSATFQYDEKAAHDSRARISALIVGGRLRQPEPAQ